MSDAEITFFVHLSPEGGYEAGAIGHSIFTQAETVTELHEMIKDALRCHFDADIPYKIDYPRPIRVNPRANIFLKLPRANSQELKAKSQKLLRSEHVLLIILGQWQSTGPVARRFAVNDLIDLAKDLVHTKAMEVNIHEAKTHLSKLLERVALGEEVVIAKAGAPVARLVPFDTKPKTRVFGSAKGEFTVPDDFNEPDPEIEAMFYKGALFPKKDVSGK